MVQPSLQAVPPTLTSTYTPLRQFSSTPINPPTPMSDSEIKTLIDSEAALFAAETASRTNSSWKPGYRRRPLSMSHDLSAFAREETPDRWLPRLNKRCGALAIKIGMMPLWDDRGEAARVYGVVGG